MTPVAERNCFQVSAKTARGVRVAHKRNLAKNTGRGGGGGGRAKLTIGIRNFILQRSQI
jgi:hypothetical protein